MKRCRRQAGTAKTKDRVGDRRWQATQTSLGLLPVRGTRKEGRIISQIRIDLDERLTKKSGGFVRERAPGFGKGHDRSGPGAKQKTTVQKG